MSDDTISPSSLPVGQLFAGLTYRPGVNIDKNMFSTHERATKKEEKKEIVPPTLLKGFSLTGLWKEVLGNNIAVLREYHDLRKEKDVIASKWEYQPDHSAGYRVVTLQTIVEVPRPGTYTLLHEAHRFALSTADSGKPKLIYQISSQTPDVPTCSTFRVEALMEVTAESMDSECTINIFANTRQMSMGFTIISPFATPRAIKELGIAYNILIGLISNKFCGKSIELKPLVEPEALAAAVPGPAEPPAAGGVGAEGGAAGRGALAVAPSSTAMYALVALALFTLIVLFMSWWSVSGSSRDLREISQMATFLRQQYSGVPSAGDARATPTQDKSHLWDLVDAALSDDPTSLPAMGTVQPTLHSGSPGARSSSSLFLSIISRQETQFERFALAMETVRSRQQQVESQCAWMWWMWLAQLVVTGYVLYRQLTA